MAEETETASGRDAYQSLTRAIDILEVVAEGRISLPDLAARLGLPRTTVYRLATRLVERGLLSASGRSGYRLGHRLAELGRAVEG